MRLLRLSEIEIGPSDRVFSYSRLNAVLLLLMLVGLAVAMTFYAVTAHWKFGYYIAAIMLMGCCLMRRFVSARFRPSNWLVRMNDTGLFIQFRSYLNYHLPTNDLTVVFVGYTELRSARLVRERARVQDPASPNSKATQTIRYAELELAGNVVPLEKALQAEQKERAPKEKRWYGNTSTLYQDYPVRMPSPPFLQIRWQVAPNLQKFLNALQPYTTMADPVLITSDFVNLQDLSREEQQRRLRELANRGQTVAAIYTARKLYGCSLSEAKALIEGTN